MLAVRFNYSEQMIHDLKFLEGYNVSMAEAVTPNKPVAALMNLKEPLYLCIAEEDELINNEALQDLWSSIQNKNPLSQIETIPHAKHIMILKNIHFYINHYLNSLLQT